MRSILLALLVLIAVFCIVFCLAMLNAASLADDAMDELRRDQGFLV